MRIDALLRKPAVGLLGAPAAQSIFRNSPKPAEPSPAAGGRLHAIARFCLPQQGMPAGFFGDISGEPVPADTTVLAVAPGQTYSSESYFNSFFLSHLREIGGFREVTLNLDFAGAGLLTIVGKAGTEEQVLARTEFAGQRTNLTVRIAGTDIAGSDYLFFRLAAKESPVSLFAARWDVVGTGERPVKLAIGICTHNRDRYLLPNMRLLLADKALMEGIHSLIVVDQGDYEHADTDGRAALSHPKLMWKAQRNLGGSGGFSRAMFEAKEKGASHILLLDDDAMYHPESVWRLLQLLKFPGPPRIWGAPMFSLAAPNEIYEASGVYQTSFNRVRSVGKGITVNGSHGLSKALRAVSAKGYSAWFFCCFDLHPGCEAGGALPFFLHFDDVELSYRLKALGYRHSVIPGLAIWHEAAKNRPPWRIVLKVRNKLILSTIPHVRSAVPGAIFAWIVYYLVRAAVRGGPGRLEAVVRGMESFAKGRAAAFDIFEEVSELRHRAPCNSMEPVPRFLRRVWTALRGTQQARKEWKNFDSAELASWHKWKAAWSGPA